MKAPTPPPAIQSALDAMPDDVRAALLPVRDLIYKLATELSVGRIEETLKWGQPSYTTPDTKVATPIRLGVSKTGRPAIFTHCQSTVMTNFQNTCPPEFEFDGNRALYLEPAGDIAMEKIAPLIGAALTYRR